MVGTLNLVRIRPAMRSRANLEWWRVASRKGDAGRRVGRDHYHDLDLPRLDPPRGLGKTVGRTVACGGVREPAAREWPNVEVAIPRRGRREAAHSSMQPVGDSP